MSKKMANAPVFYALAQCRFNPIDAMEKYFPEIQESLRLLGYSGRTEIKAQNLTVNAMNDAAQASLTISDMTFWICHKADQTSGFVLGTDSLSFHTTHYETSETFLPEIIKGLRIVHEIVKLEHFSRIALRYLDLVLPKENENAVDYFVEGLRGLPNVGKHLYSTSESYFETESGPSELPGKLLARIFMTEGPVVYPPGLSPHGLVSLERFKGKNQPYGMIDTDYSVEGMIPVDFELVDRQLTHLHAGVKAAFYSIITPPAESVWA